MEWIILVVPEVVAIVAFFICVMRASSRREDSLVQSLVDRCLGAVGGTDHPLPLEKYNGLLRWGEDKARLAWAKECTLLAGLVSLSSALGLLVGDARYRVPGLIMAVGWILLSCFTLMQREPRPDDKRAVVGVFRRVVGFFLLYMLLGITMKLVVGVK